MEGKIISAVLLVSILALVIGLWIPMGDIPQNQALPWQIEIDSSGATRVFGLTLDRSTLKDAEQHLHSIAEITMFVSPDQPSVVEAYFDNINAGALSAKIVVGINVSATQLQFFNDNSARISTLASGSHKVSLREEGLTLVRSLPIASIAYLPRVRLDQDLLIRRFGEPQRRLVEPLGATEHWLYPQLGLDVAMDNKGHAVMQYVSPANFSRLLQPLEVNNNTR